MKTVKSQIIICGASLGGTLAAYSAAGEGKNVVLLEGTKWIGGQLTSQAVPPDEHPWIEDQGCTKTGDEVEQQEFLCAPLSLQYASEHVHGIHVKEDVRKTAMHEKMRQRLPPVEEWRCRIEQRKIFIHEICVELGHDHDQNIYNDNILDSCRYVAHEATSFAAAVILIKAHI